MSTWMHGFALAALGAAIAAGCAGDGTGLDEFGNPLGVPHAPLEPTLSSLEANVFGPICSQCHTGAAAPLGLALDPGVVWRNVVGVPSVERPELMRVTPGEPDASYLVWKIEGRSGILGGRMPLGLPRLSDEQITAIKQWIDARAPDN